MSLEARKVALTAGLVATGIGVLVWSFWPKPTYQSCMVRMAEKAQGNSTIFRDLARSNCVPLRSELSRAEALVDSPGLFDDLSNRKP